MGQPPQDAAGAFAAACGGPLDVRQLALQCNAPSSASPESSDVGCHKREPFSALCALHQYQLRYHSRCLQGDRQRPQQLHRREEQVVKVPEWSRSRKPVPQASAACMGSRHVVLRSTHSPSHPTPLKPQQLASDSLNITEKRRESDAHSTSSSPRLVVSLS